MLLNNQITDKGILVELNWLPVKLVTEEILKFIATQKHFFSPKDMDLSFPQWKKLYENSKMFQTPW